MENLKNKTSLATAALTAGLGLLIMVIAAPFAELYAFPKLIIPHQPAETAKNIIAHRSLFIFGILGYMITFICDVVVAWALYVLLKPVNNNISLLTAWFRLAYSIIALVSLLNLVNAFWLFYYPDFTIMLTPDQLNTQLLIFLRSFRNGFNFGIILFGIHLLLLGCLVFISNYIPKLLGLLLILAGLGYLVTSLEPYLFPAVKVDFAKFTFYGELIFMLWLIIKGSRLREQTG